MGQRGQGFGFKKNRLVRMFESEINWLDTYFGERAVTTEDYAQHDNRWVLFACDFNLNHDVRIKRNWAAKLGRNKDRLIKRLQKCGGLTGEGQKVEASQGGFADYDEDKAKELEKQPEEDKPKDEIENLSTDQLAQTGGNRRPAANRGRRNAVESFEHTAAEMALITQLDFDLAGEEELEVSESNDIQARSRGQRQQQQRPRQFEVKRAVGEIRNILQGFAIWAKNHISKCEPNQPQKQMQRASKWFKVLGKKVVVKSMHITSARREGLKVLNT